MHQRSAGITHRSAGITGLLLADGRTVARRCSDRRSDGSSGSCTDERTMT
jgi:hypothetical protein